MANESIVTSATPEGVPTPPNPRAVRLRAELPQVRVCAMVPCAPITLRMYEANPNAVSPAMRRRLDRIYAELARTTPHAA